jgi:hypothetical protein
VTTAGFRRLALALQDAVEGAHMGHPDFRVNGRIFATLHAGQVHGMVKLSPEQQQRFIDDHPQAFVPESGAWGRAGCTRVTLKAVGEETLGEALTLAWQSASAQPPARAPKKRAATPKRVAKKR